MEVGKQWKTQGDSTLERIRIRLRMDAIIKPSMEGRLIAATPTALPAQGILMEETITGHLTQVVFFIQKSIHLQSWNEP
jgi:hypothetical protein